MSAYNLHIMLAKQILFINIMVMAASGDWNPGWIPSTFSKLKAKPLFRKKVNKEPSYLTGTSKIFETKSRTSNSKLKPEI